MNEFTHSFLSSAEVRRKKIGFIGLGLIGGSIARAIRQYYPEYTITAFDKNKETLALATQESVIDVAAVHIDDSFRGCDYIFLCAPVSYNNAYLKQVACYLKEGCIVAMRHIHMSPKDAQAAGVKDGDIVSVKADNERGTIFNHVKIRVDDSFTLEMHIDTDEANAAQIATGNTVTIIK